MGLLCQQCGRPAFYRIEFASGVLNLCIECDLKRQHGESLEFQRNMQLMNSALALFGLQSGIPVPKLPMSSVPIMPITNMNTSNIRVENSTVGVVNLGYIQTVDRAVTLLRQAGANDVANALTQLTQGVLDNRDVSDQQRKEILEILSAIGTESQKSTANRAVSVVRALAAELATLFSGLAGLSDLWNTYSATIKSFFGI